LDNETVLTVPQNYAEKINTFFAKVNRGMYSRGNPAPTADIIAHVSLDSWQKVAYFSCDQKLGEER